MPISKTIAKQPCSKTMSQKHPRIAVRGHSLLVSTTRPANNRYLILATHDLSSFQSTMLRIAGTTNDEQLLTLVKEYNFDTSGYGAVSWAGMLPHPDTSDKADLPSLITRYNILPADVSVSCYNQLIRNKVLPNTRVLQDTTIPFYKKQLHAWSVNDNCWVVVKPSRFDQRDNDEQCYALPEALTEELFKLSILANKPIVCADCGKPVPDPQSLIVTHANTKFCLTCF